MSKDRFGEQLDLFGRAPAVDEDDLAATLDEPPPEDFIERIRDELLANLAKARAAQSLPWEFLDALMLERRFRSIAGWLPREEARKLRAEFAVEIARLYAAAEEAWRSAQAH